MTSSTTLFSAAFYRRAWLLLLAVILATELILIGTLHKHAIAFDCRANWSVTLCSGASGTLISVYALSAALLLYFVLRPHAFAHLIDHTGFALMPLGLNLAGFAIALLPLTFLSDGSGLTYLIPAFAAWTLGFALLVGGMALHVAPLRRWRTSLAPDARLLLGTAAIVTIAPYLATLVRPVWKLEFIAGVTFDAVARTTQALGYALDINDPVKKHIGTHDFTIAIAPQCSGLEGIALVTVFVTVFLALFREELRFPRAFWLYPAGIAVSMFLNFVRITILLIIGIEGSPDLAVGGFHSHAGWLMFTIIALGIVLCARAIPALQKEPGLRMTARKVLQIPPVQQDMNAARIVPFMILLVSGIFAQAFSQTPGLVYPLRAIAMGAALVFFWDVLRRIDWRPSPVSIMAGAGVGVLWILVPYTPAETSPAHGGLAGGVLLAWLIVRGFGTILLVPIIEELFFRDYLESRIRGLCGPLLTALISAALFAALHDRWAEAFVAGLVFSWVMAQRRNVADAIAAHATANALIYAFAVITGSLYII